MTSTTPKFLLKDSSNVSIKTLVNAADIDIAASIGPLGVFIKDGHLRLDNGTPGQPAVFSIGLATNASHQHELATLLGAPGSIVTTTANGKFDVDLPLHFPTSAEKKGSIHVSVADLKNIAGTTDLDRPRCRSGVGDQQLD